MRWKDGVIYANAVAKGNINVCRNVTLACQRFLNALENKSWEWQFDPKAVQHVLDFAGLMLHVKGPWANSRVELQPFQILIICAIYGFWHKRQKIRRMTQDVIVFVPRKAGKSTLIAILAIYELMFGEAGSEVLTLATNREQASIVFQAASGLIDTLPASVRKKYNCGKHQITKVGDTQSVFRALSRDTKKSGDGFNPSCAIVDEAAQILDRNAIEVIHSGMVARVNPLRIYISTASFTKDTKFYEDLQMLENILNGHAPDNPRWFGLLYSLDAADDWRESESWRKANPMHGVSVFDDAVAKRAEEAKAKPAALNEFLCKTLNVWVSASSAWLDREHWDKSIGLTDRIPERVFVGFDLAATRDLNAVCTLKRFSELDFEVHWRFFLPEAALSYIPTHYKDVFQLAMTSGILKTTQGNVMDDREIAEYIIEEWQRFDVAEVGYDAYNAASLVARLHEHGVPMKRVGQGMAVLSNPSKHVEKLILSQKIKHDGNPFLGWQLANCEVYENVQGNIKIRKNENDKAAKVDGIIALIIAMHCALDNPAVNDSWGFRTF
jgi:phage terminase large subunit-like protein